MGDSSQNVWQCPLCGRRVPVHIDTCRCGLARDQVEPSLPVTGTRRVRVVASKAARTLFVALAALVLAATGATALMVLISKRAVPPKTSQKIRVLSRLDNFTRKAGPRARNTIPDFLATSGRLGVLEGNAADETSAKNITPISEVELGKGVCSPNVSALIRHLYPGSYDSWPDARLEKSVLAQHPEYRGRLCVLPLWIEATPHDIVKYELIPQAGAAAQ